MLVIARMCGGPIGPHRGGAFVRRIPRGLIFDWFGIGIWKETVRLVRHEPLWTPADLPINAEGDTAPGYVCAHPLENGNGPCGGNVFRIEDATGDHSCMVRE